jgi:cell wall-associated NlpC family hydrolase
MKFKGLTTAVTASALALSFAFSSATPVQPIQAQASEQEEAYSATKYVYSYDGTLNMRKAADAKSGKVQTLKNGKKVSLSAKKVIGNTTWVYGTANGKSGWMNASYLVSTKKVSDVSDVIAYGQKFLGTPYVWGGTTPSGFDCSGFTGYVYRNVLGKSLPRTSGAQYAASKHISKDAAQVGDLVFFSGNGRSITHVAIYAGNNKLLHAAGKQVKYSELYDGYWNKRLVGFGTFR